MNKKIKIAFASMLAVPLLACAQVRTEQTFEKGWKFTREDSKDFSNSTYDDAKWQSVTVPHDWAIYGPFSINNDKQNVAISQDGKRRWSMPDVPGDFLLSVWDGIGSILMLLHSVRAKRLLWFSMEP